jgi:hypothetical protein
MDNNVVPFLDRSLLLDLLRPLVPEQAITDDSNWSSA